MPDLPHLFLPRIESEQPRRRRGTGRPPARNSQEHGAALEGELDEVVQIFHARRPPEGVNPDLILRVDLNAQAAVNEETWERCGLTLLSVDRNKTLILFSSDEQMLEFRRRLGEYREGPRAREQQSAPYGSIFSSIDSIAAVQPEDRIGRLLRRSGIQRPDDLPADTQYVIDVELWDFGGREANTARVNQIQAFLRQQGAESTDQFIGESLVLLRVRALGHTIRELLTLDAVALLDLPPQPSLRVAEMLQADIRRFPLIPEPAADAPAIAILDSGLASAHPLLAPAIGEATAIPLALGDGADEHGHGTLVAGLALYGHVRNCIEAGQFTPALRLYSARVLNANCTFDNEALITTQMRDAIRYFSETYGCRVFNLSLGDDNLPYAGGKVSPWASVLDTLARDLDVLIVVSAGNFVYRLRDEEFVDAHLQRYPRYLLEDEARIIEPATGAIVLTVGALSHSERLPVGAGDRDVAMRPISHEGEPSPFTRTGPGLGGSIKPELCDHGGNRCYDGRLAQIRDLTELSIISTNREYLRRLFATSTGTSFAAPKVAHEAARLTHDFPGASANLIRALLVSSASVPPASAAVLSGLADSAIQRVCGYGRPDYNSARLSQENRVVLYSDAALRHDRFHVYEIPIPDEFRNGRSLRTIEITLAYDPPVRHSRFDYLGTKMSFRLIRGKTVQEVVAAFRRQGGGAEPVDGLTSTRFHCSMDPKPTNREGGTLQKAIFRMPSRSPHDYGSTYHLVVRCERKWARDEHEPQRYAAVVVIRQEGDVDIYQQIAQRVRPAARARVR